jgi:hypothetical protein
MSARDVEPLAAGASFLAPPNDALDFRACTRRLHLEQRAALSGIVREPELA